MKEKKWWYWIIAIVSVIAVGFLIYFSIQYDMKTNDNATTTIAGLWSAAATAVLGFIAVWQNMRYKKMSDKYNAQILDMTSKPEICLLSINKPFQEDDATIVLNTGIGSKETTLSVKLQTLDKAIVNFTIVKLLWIDGNSEPIAELHQTNLKTSFDASKVFLPNQIIIINVNNYDDNGITQKSSVQLVIEYENIYQDKYVKVISFSLTRGVNSFNPSNIVTQRAKRLEISEAE